MTGSTDLGPIRPPQMDSVAMPLIMEKGFFHGEVAPPSYLARPDLRLARRVRMNAPSSRPVQLTPLWEYVVRTKKFPKNVEVSTIFEEISERLRDPEWEVRQHALRVLVDVLPTIGPEAIDELASLVLADLIDNLGHPAPAVRKGSLDALRIYLLHSPRRDEMAKKILYEGMNRADVLDEYQTRVATGVILSAPLLLFPSRSGTRPSTKLVREASQALAMRLGQVTHQESALRSLCKIRDAVGRDEFNSYLAELDDAMIRNFELLRDVYGISSDSARRKRRPRSKSVIDKLRRADSLDNIKDVVPVDKSWDTDDDSDTSGIAEEDEDGLGSGSSLTSARVVLETEIKFNEETAITMTILEDQGKHHHHHHQHHKHHNVKEVEQREVDEKDVRVEIEDEHRGVAIDDRRKTPRRVHFGGEIVKLRTPDSEDADSVNSSILLGGSTLQPLPPHLRTRIPLPVSPATTMPRRPRSSSQPMPPRRVRLDVRRRRSASSSPGRGAHLHLATLSPKKGILCRGSDFGERHFGYMDRPFEIQQPRIKSPRISRRDSMTPPISSPRIVIEEIVDDPPEKEPSFRVCEDSTKLSSVSQIVRSPSPSLLGEVVDSNKSMDNIDNLFGDKSGPDSKMQKDYENMIKAFHRPSSALENKSDFLNDQEFKNYGKERRRSSSAKSQVFETFPRKERNYILMELSSPTKDRSRRSSLENNQSPRVAAEVKSSDDTTTKESSESTSGDKKEQEHHFGEKVEDVKSELVANDDGANDKERSSDSSDGEMKIQEPSWEELGLVEDEVLSDFHNKEDWRARVRGLERIASAMRMPASLSAVEPRLGSLLHAVLGGERSCRVAAAGLAVANIVLTGVSEEALKDRLSLITWGLARQGGPNACNLARVAMLRASPKLFLDKLLQPQCIGARNAKMRENALQLLIFSLVTFPSTEFEVRHAIDKIVEMVGDPRKRVRLAALETLSVMSQIYESEDILELSKRLTKGKQEEHDIQAAIKTRLGRKLLPTVSVDGLVVYGLQVSSNSQHTGADVDWINAGSGSVTPGTGRTRGQLIAMTKIESSSSDQNNERTRPTSEYYADPSGVSNNKLLDKSERIASWKLLPQSDEYGKPHQKVNYTKSADFSTVKRKEFDTQSEEAFDKYSHIQKPYATPKRNERKTDYHDTRLQEDAEKEYNSSQVRGSSSAPAPDRIVPRLESRIPIYTGGRGLGFKPTVVDSSSTDSSGYLNMQQRRKSNLHLKGSVPRATLGINSFGSKSSHISSPYDDLDSDFQSKFKEGRSSSPFRGFKTDNRALSDEKLNGNYETSDHRLGLRSVPNYIYNTGLSDSYESIYQRQRRLKEERGLRGMYEVAPNPLYNGYEGYLLNRKFQTPLDHRREFKRDVQFLSRGHQTKKPIFASPFDDRTFSRTTGILMIFKYCVWSDPAKDEPNKALINGNGRVASAGTNGTPVTTILREQPVCGRKLVEGLLGCCPCAFRCRRAIGIDTPATTPTPIQENGTVNGDLLELKINGCGEPIGNGDKIKSDTDSSSNQVDSGCTTTPPAARNSSLQDGQRSSPGGRHQELDEVRSNSGRSSSSSSNRSSRSSGGQDRTKFHHQTLTAHTESDESNPGCEVDARSRTSSAGRDDDDKAFDVISDKQKAYDAISISDGRSSSGRSERQHHPSPATMPGRSSSSDSLSDLAASRSLGRSRSALSIGKSLATVSEQRRLSKHSLESLLSDRSKVGNKPRLALNGYTAERTHAGGDGPSRPSSRCSSERLYDKEERKMNAITRSNTEFNEKNHDVNGHADPESPSDEEEEKAAFETLDFRNTSRDTSSAASVNIPPSTRSRRSSIDNDHRATDANFGMYNCNTGAPSPKVASPKRFISEDSAFKDTDYSDDSPPVPIGFNSTRSTDSTDETDDVGCVKPQHTQPQSRLATPMEHQLSRRGTTGMLAASKVAPCKLKPQPSCRSNLHHVVLDKAPNKTVQQCFSHLESKDWEVTLKGLRTLSQVAREEPEQLDACAPGQLARVLGRHVKNLRSQVARVACSAAGEVFSSHIRGIDQDLDEIAGPLLHRTADTNKFLREDCNAALDVMVEHFPPHRTIMTIANRGASHQNTIVHATTARLLYLVVTEIGPEHVMILPRDVKDKLFLTTAKLLTDGHLQARKHAKETFRLLSRCEGFRKALTDAVPETTLRLIDKTLKSL